MIVINLSTSITKVNGRDLKTPIKRQRWSNVLQKQQCCYLQETSFRYKDAYSLKIKECTVIKDITLLLLL